MRLNMVTGLMLNLASLGSLSICASSPRTALTGDFTVCGFPHYMHASCYERWEKGCALCARAAKDPEKEWHEDTLYVSKSSDLDCAICKMSLREPFEDAADMRPRPSAPPEDILPVALPALRSVARASSSVSLSPKSFYAQHQYLQQAIKDARGEHKAALIQKAKQIQASQFRHK